ncbi:MAG: hypothetical protein ACREC6_01390 [Hyphomicrobiaceae bacterium]
MKTKIYGLLGAAALIASMGASQAQSPLPLPPPLLPIWPFTMMCEAGSKYDAAKMMCVKEKAAAKKGVKKAAAKKK